MELLGKSKSECFLKLYFTNATKTKIVCFLTVGTSFQIEHVGMKPPKAMKQGYRFSLNRRCPRIVAALE